MKQTLLRLLVPCFLSALLIPVAVQAQTTIAFQGFEDSANDDWRIATGSPSISSNTGSGDTPSNERIRSGSSSWQVNNLLATLELKDADVSGFTSVQATLHLSSTAGSSSEGADPEDEVRIFIALNGAAFSETPDLVVQGNADARYGYSSTTASTDAGTPATFQPAGGGDRSGSSDDYSTLVIDVPDGTNSVALRVIAVNDNGDEYWNLDDLTLTGTPSTTETRVRFVSASDAETEGDTGTKTYPIRLRIINPDATNATTATVAVTGGSAAAGTDYVYDTDGTPSEKSVTFPANSSDNQEVTVTLNGDTDVEGDETIIFELQNVTGGNDAQNSAGEFTLSIEGDDASPVNAWINELHYDNDGTDEDEFVEIAVPSGFSDFANLQIVHYNGNGGGSIVSVDGTGLSQGAIQGDFQLYSWIRNPSDTRFQNGPDGFALCYLGDLVVSGGVAQFLSYEGTFTATVGCASGRTSTDIGINQTGTSATPVGSSIGLTGSGTSYSDFTWARFNNPPSNGSTVNQPNDQQSLPVELVSFEAVADGADVALTWATASEQNNAGFHVEHRRLGSSEAAFATLAFVAGHGTTSEPQRYAFRAEGLAPGRHAFRLRQVDLDGAASYSPTVEVLLAAELPEGYRLGAAYPNPFNPTATFELEVERAQEVRVGLYDVLGREVAVLFEGALEGGEVAEVTIEGGGLPSGLYLYRAEGETFQATRRVALVK